MRILFMGTPEFAVEQLRRLVEMGHEICGVFTQPDKPKNRGMKLAFSPVKEYALTQGLEVYQPTKMRDGTALAIVEKLQRRGHAVTIDNIYAYVQDVAGIRIICNYLDDIYYLRRLLTRNESFRVLQEVDYIKNPKPSGYRSLHLIVEVPIVISEGTLHLPVEIQLRTIAMDMWASLEHELRYKSSRAFSEADANRLRVCSEAVYEVDREMQNIYKGRQAEYEESEPESTAEP